MVAGVRQFAQYQPFTPIIENPARVAGREPASASSTIQAIVWCVGIAVNGFVWALSTFKKARPDHRAVEPTKTTYEESCHAHIRHGRPICRHRPGAGARVRVTATDRTDTWCSSSHRRGEPVGRQVAGKTKVEFAGGQLSVKTTVSGDKNGSVAITIDLPAGSSLVAYLAHSSVQR
jgi:hypothetical protein